ncbi:hypothetical protein B0H66DRAFT_255486 [Apodospora peruviana]|uniref:FAD-binding domain-containing protein n=1 Tax=Apodospora peruviana TaxID=516989 RepID=A0AAE0I666_9PEZI|nr:hypothetical protein B0H66DRAFT_255486 [Apodospora peruviana]
MAPLTDKEDAISSSSSSNPRPSPAAPFRIAIIGGGIGGIVTALFLHHFCSQKAEIEIDIYEQAPQYREIGAGIGLGVNATKLLVQIPGLVEAINTISGTRNGVWFTLRRWDDGDEIVTMGADESGKVRFAAVSRAELLDVLTKFLVSKDDGQREKARVHNGKKLRLVEDISTNGGIKMTFSDETTASADLLIASDGIHSAVRKQFVSDTALYGGKIIYRGLVPISSLAGEWPLPSYAAMWIGQGKHFLTYAIAANKMLNVVACTTKSIDEIPDLKESWSSTCDRRELEQDFGDCGDELVQKVVGLMDARVAKWRLNDRDPVEDWVFMDGKVVLLGDAAHPMVPHQSAGAGQAVEDGYILAKTLGEYLSERSENRSGRLKEWMELYQRVRLPRAQRTQETSREAGELFEMKAPGMEGKTYNERLPILVERVKDRMKWIWSEDIDAAYGKVKGEMGLVTCLEGEKNEESRVNTADTAEASNEFTSLNQGKQEGVSAEEVKVEEERKGLKEHGSKGSGWLSRLRKVCFCL